MILALTLFLAQAPAAESTGSPILNFIPLVFLLGAFYFFFLRPQQRRQKEHETLIKAIKVGDRVRTSGGMHGTVFQVKDTTVIIEVAERVKVEFDQGSIVSQIGGDAKTDKSSK